MVGCSNMPTSYTNITKPSGTGYTNLNPIGKQQYDQSDVAYDASDVFYDGISASQYTTVAKPTISDGLWYSWISPWELALPWQAGVSPYTRIQKP